MRRGQTAPQKTIAGYIQAAGLLAGCSGDLTGTIYYTTKGGDVKRVAGEQVVLAQATPEYERALEEARAANAAAIEAAQAVLDEAVGRYEEAKALHDRQPMDLASDNSPYNVTRRASLKAESDMRAAQVELEAVSRRPEPLPHTMVYRTQTDVNGRFEFNGVRPGRYYVTATVIREFPGETLHWEVPLGVTSGRQNLDLTNSNMAAIR